MTRLVLASASKSRLDVLARAGLDPVVLVSGVDENAVAAGFPADITDINFVCGLAGAKAAAVADALPPELAGDCVVLGCDSMLAFDGELWGKPHDAETARRRWVSMAGRAGTLLTGHVLLRVVSGRVLQRETQCGSTVVEFGSPDDAELDAYIASGEPLGVAGGFTIDGRGGWFVQRIDGDPSNVTGVSLPLVRQILRRMQISPTDLSNAQIG